MTTPQGPGPARSADACRLAGVGVTYGTTRAVSDVDLRITAGETVALVGPSGAGKTTLLRTIAGLVRPDEGEVAVHGRPLAEMRPGEELTRLVGMMQQRLDLVPQLSAVHNVQAGLLGRWGLLRSLAALLLPIEHEEATEAIARVGLTPKRHQRVGELSGGEQQRVALARLLVQDPAVLLADEPISSLDPAMSDDLLALLCGLARDADRTVVTSLHEPDFARRHFDRVVGVRAGRVVFDQQAHQVTDLDLETVYRIETGREGREATSAPPRDGVSDGCGSVGRQADL